MPKLKHISFVDEVFGLNDAWVEKFSDLYSKEIRIPFDCDSYPGRQSKNVIEKLSKTGLIKVNIGVQTCSDRILKNVYHRYQKSDDILRDDEIYHTNHMMPTYDFIIDNPYETPQDLLDTITIAEKLQRPTFFRIYSLFFFPYYPLTIKAEQDGICDTASYNLDYYHKITTNHLGDQYSNQSWYLDPYTTMKKGDPKAALNWILTCYGDPYIPKRLVDFALKDYYKKRIIITLFLAFYYKFLDKYFQNGFLSQIFTRSIKQNGVRKTMDLIIRKYFSTH